jgi:hypothetical protein
MTFEWYYDLIIIFSIFLFFLIKIQLSGGMNLFSPDLYEHIILITVGNSGIGK